MNLSPCLVITKFVTEFVTKFVTELHYAHIWLRANESVLKLSDKGGSGRGANAKEVGVSQSGLMWSKNIKNFTTCRQVQEVYV